MEDDMGRACHTCEAEAKCVERLVRKHEVKRELGEHRCTWDDNIKMDLNTSVM
jgi:hypothetical protein